MARVLRSSRVLCRSRRSRVLVALPGAAAVGLLFAACSSPGSSSAGASSSDASGPAPTATSTAGSSSPTSGDTSSASSSATSSEPATTTSSTSPSGSGGGAGSAAVAILPTPNPSIGPGADKGSALRAKVKGVDLGLLGRVPTGKPYPIGKVGPRGITDSGTWPDACALLSDADIKTLLPKGGKPHRQGQHGSFLGGGETRHFASCKYQVLQPGDSSVVPSYFDIDIDVVGDPAAVKQRWEESFAQQKKAAATYPDQFWDYSGGQLGGAQCFYDGNAIRCAKGHYSFTVLGGSGKNSGGGNAAYAQGHGYVQQVHANVAKTIALRMH